jgi:MFS family permease
MSAEHGAPLSAQLSPSQRSAARRNAIRSALCGCVAEVMLDSSAVVILYIAMLGGSDTFALFSTSLSGIAYTLLLIPFSGITDRVGLQRSVNIACSVGAAAFVLMALAPLAGDAAKHVVIAGCLVFGLTRPLYLTAWYPLLGNFLLPPDRSHFFSTMRFAYMLLNTVIFALIGLALGKHPPLWLLQAVIAAAGLLLLGRQFFIGRLPVEQGATAASAQGLAPALGMSIRNAPLTGFSIYACCLTFANCAVTPLSFIYLKSRLDTPANLVVIISSLGMAGTIVGYLAASHLIRRLGTRWVQIATHAVFILVPLGCFLCGKGLGAAVTLIAALLFVNSFAGSCFSVCASSEMLALAPAANRTMAAAFCNTCINLGNAIGRTGIALTLGSGLLAAEWTLNGVAISRYQSLFLFFALAASFFLILLVLIPSVVPKHEDYYEP